MDAPKVKGKVPSFFFPDRGVPETGYHFGVDSIQTEVQCFIDPTHRGIQALFEISKAITNPLRLTKLAAEDLPSSISKVPTIIIGMDVSRDGAPPDPHAPSIAAVVHSRGWPNISEYRAYVCTQSSKLEMDTLYKPERGSDGKIRDLGIIRDLLQDFCDNSKRRPEQIVIFRYGFNGSQSTQALDAEVELIDKACKLYDEKMSPKFLVIKFFEPEGPEIARPARILEFDPIITVRPLKYEVAGDGVGLSADEVRELVDSLSYVHEVRVEAIDLVAPFCYGPKSKKQQFEEHRDKRPKTKMDLEKVDLGRVRDYITDFEELAVYALGRWNANQPGNKHEFERYLYGDEARAYRGDDCSKLDKWQHVSMYAKDVNGERKIIFAELGYSNGEYDTVTHSILDPKDEASYRYGCGFCFPAFGGPHPSPHPIDRSRYAAGHWPNVKGVFSGIGPLRPPKSVNGI